MFLLLGWREHYEKSGYNCTGRRRQIRLSEAILMGCTVVIPKAGRLDFLGENAACALGMAVIAGEAQL
jgi:hypothetical protein